MTHTQFSPKDFFLWLGVVVSLYASVGSLIALLFNYINVLLPDALEASYYDPYSAPTRFAMASLVIAFPLFIVLMRMVHVDVREHKEKEHVAVRKWLVYLTVFAAGALVAGDLVALINTFLNGEITQRFLLKVVSILLVAGGVFWYFLEEIRGRWLQEEKLSKRIAYGVSSTILVVFLSGFTIIGTPADARAYRFDEQRVQDLQSLEWSIISYYQAKRALPETLASLQNAQGTRIPVDPETAEAYTYVQKPPQQAGEASYELCASFSRETKITREQKERLLTSDPIPSTDWSHEAGRHCFQRTIDPAFYPPLQGVVDRPEPLPF